MCYTYAPSYILYTFCRDFAVLVAEIFLSSPLFDGSEDDGLVEVCVVIANMPSGGTELEVPFFLFTEDSSASELHEASVCTGMYV